MAASKDGTRLLTRPHTRSQAVGPRTQSLALTSPGGPSLQFNIDIMFILFNCLSPHRRCVTTPAWPCPMRAHCSRSHQSPRLTDKRAGQTPGMRSHSQHQDRSSWPFCSSYPIVNIRDGPPGPSGSHLGACGLESPVSILALGSHDGFRNQCPPRSGSPIPAITYCPMH